jgi:hypothetical protein
MKKAMLLFAVALIVWAALEMAPVDAAPAPPIPEFAVRFGDSSRDVPPSTSVDPYTGNNVTSPGYHVTSGFILLTIRNPVFDNSGTFRLYYNVRSKGHYEADGWILRTENLYTFTNGMSEIQLPIKPSQSEYTELRYPANYAPDSEVDFEVQAVVYNMTQVFVSDHPALYPSFASQSGYSLSVPKLIETGEWSGAQTVKDPLQGDNFINTFPRTQPILH